MALPLKGTFFAFRRRGRGGVILGATVSHVVLLLAVMVTLAVLNARLIGLVEAGGVEDGTVMPIGVVGASLGGLFLYAVIAASYEAALLRWMIRGETAGFGGFSLGGDTWRVYAGYWLWFAVAAGLWLAAMLLSVLIVAALGVSQGQSPAETAWVGFMAIGLWVLLLTPFALRMCSGNAASIARRRFSYFESWRVSRDRTLALLGSFFTLWLVWVALALALFLGASFVVYTLVPEEPSGTGLGDLLTVLGLAGALQIANFVMTILAAGVNARATLAAIEEGKLDGLTPDLANVFD